MLGDLCAGGAGRFNGHQVFRCLGEALQVLRVGSVATGHLTPAVASDLRAPFPELPRSTRSRTGPGELSPRAGPEPHHPTTISATRL